MNTWDKLPLNLMDELAESETYRRDVYRPIYSLHKWWARRPGSTFRCLGLATLTDDMVTKDDILIRRTSGSHDGLYINPDEDRINNDVTVLDPFAGGGTTLVELNRLGADVTGYELNPVAWWIEKKSMDNVDLHMLKEEFNRLLDKTREELNQYYTTVDPDTGQECETLFYFKSQRIPCLTCEEEVQLFPHYELAKPKKTRPGFLYCPNQQCDNRIIKVDRETGLDADTDVPLADGGTATVTEDGNEICPNCSTEFGPRDGNYSRGKYTCSNGHRHDIKETLTRLDEKPTFDRFALEYVTPQGDKQFKEYTEEDEARVEAAREHFEEIKESLPIPDQQIPEGMAMTTGALRNYKYETFDELFTDRHLLTYGLLFRKAWEVREKEFEDTDAQNIAEFLITTISNNLEYNGKLVKWNPRYSISGHVFERHAFIPRVQPIEGNPLNTERNSNSLQNFYDKTEEAKEYCKRPFEKIKNPVTGNVEQFYVNGETISEQRVTGLNCKTSERLEEDDESVDYIITDPPYYDNVQYSKLSDYFYVWLRECLHGEYEAFEPELVPKAREIVANRKSNKDEEFFINSLANVFSECNRVLKPNGEMVFTYHHNENEAWSVILEALIQSGFTVTGAYPVQSEMSISSHVSNLDNAEYDIIIFATKESADDQITMPEFRQQLYFEIQDLIDQERERHKDLSKADLGVILRGKCLYYYSRHYPDVYSEGKQVNVDEALAVADEIIEQAIDESITLPPSIDALSQAYAAFVNRGWEDYDELNKNLLAKNLNVSDMEDEKLVQGPRDRKEPVPADERIHHIERKLNDNGPQNAEGLLDIDKVHYLYHLYKTDQNTSEYLNEWKTGEVEELADFIADVTGDDRYESVMQMNLSQF